MKKLTQGPQEQAHTHRRLPDVCDETHKTNMGMQFSKLRTHREIKQTRAATFFFAFSSDFQRALTETEAETGLLLRGMSDCRRGAHYRHGGDSYDLDDLPRKKTTSHCTSSSSSSSVLLLPSG